VEEVRRFPDSQLINSTTKIEVPSDEDPAVLLCPKSDTGYNVVIMTRTGAMIVLSLKVDLLKVKLEDRSHFSACAF
jgi:hypothetical protein